MNVLITGGAGYIGSHAALRLLEDGHAVTIVDDLSRGHRKVIDILAPLGDLHFVQADVAHTPVIAPLMKRRSIEAVMHFAALCSVAESVHEPLRYWRVNVGGTLGLLDAMYEAGVGRIVFSSSAATYGQPPPECLPICEECPQRPINPYGWSKLVAEQALQDHAASQREKNEPLALSILRYFNVAGCDRRGRLGEDHDPETHLIPICLDAALESAGGADVTIFGSDYDTPDGTCIRDYVHIEDLVDAHLAALRTMSPGESRLYNVGIGRGWSVREVVDACRKVTGVNFRISEGPRRAGDPASLFADARRIMSELNWSARLTDIHQVIESAWRWRRANPTGYRDKACGRPTSTKRAGRLG